MQEYIIDSNVIIINNELDITHLFWQRMSNKTQT